MHGLWGEVGDRTRRALRSREQQGQASEQRLQDFLAAIPGPPNGVVLLDAQGESNGATDCGSPVGIDASATCCSDRNLVRDPGLRGLLRSPGLPPRLIVTGNESTSSRPVRVSVQLHPYGEGRQLLLTRDITALKQAETMRRDFVANVCTRSARRYTVRRASSRPADSCRWRRTNGPATSR